MTHVLIDRAVLQQVLDALWVLKEHNRMMYGDTHNTATIAGKAHADLQAAHGIRSKE